MPIQAHDGAPARLLAHVTRSQFTATSCHTADAEAPRRPGVRMDPGAGPSSAPPDEEAAVDGDGGAERSGRREQRGDGTGAAFDALRKAKAEAEVGMKQWQGRGDVQVADARPATARPQSGRLTLCVLPCRTDGVDLLSSDDRVTTSRPISDKASQSLARQTDPSIVAQARSAARAEGRPLPEPKPAAEGASSSDDSDEELVLVPEVRQSSVSGCHPVHCTVIGTLARACRRRIVPSSVECLRSFAASNSHCTSHVL